MALSIPNGWIDQGTVDPMESSFFQTLIGSDDTGSKNSYRDSIFSQVLAGVPGMDSFYWQNGGSDDTSASGINPELLAQYLAQNGYSLRNAVHGGGGRVWAEDGSGGLLGTPQDYSNQDTAFGIASSLLGAAGGGFMGGLNGLGSVASGAMSGGMAAGAQDADLGSIAKGAVIGGAMGGARDYFNAGYSGLDYGDGSAFPAGDGSAWTPSVPTMDLPQGWADMSGVTGPIDAALNQPMLQLDPSGALSPGLESMLPQTTGFPWDYGSNLADPNMMTGGGNALTGGVVTPDFTSGMPQYMQPFDSIMDGSTGEPVRFDTNGGRPAAQAVQPIDLPPGWADMPPMGATPEPTGQLDPSGTMPAALPPMGPAMPNTGGDTSLKDLLKIAAPVVGAIAGSQPTGGGTATQQSRLDPRMEEMLYGQGGLLGSMKDWYAANKSGTNATIQEGQNMQLGMLRDPNTMAGLQSLRGSAMGLLGGPIAGNPFASNPFKFPG